MNTHGGKRNGAGRKPGSKNKNTLIKRLEEDMLREKIKEALEPVIDAQLANATGLKYLVVRNKTNGRFERIAEAGAKLVLGNDEETVEVWEKDPSSHAAQMLLDRAYGKPRESLNVDVRVEIDLADRLVQARKRVQTLQPIDTKALPEPDSETNR